MTFFLVRQKVFEDFLENFSLLLLIIIIKYCTQLSDISGFLIEGREFGRFFFFFLLQNLPKCFFPSDVIKLISHFPATESQIKWNKKEI